MNRIVIATALAAGFWALKRWLDSHHGRIAQTKREAMDSWENEGGALAPHPSGLETSQVPR